MGMGKNFPISPWTRIACHHRVKPAVEPVHGRTHVHVRGCTVIPWAAR